MPECKICGQVEDDSHRLNTCEKCGRAVCPQHFAMVKVEALNKVLFIYLCTEDRDKLQKELEELFDRYRG